MSKPEASLFVDTDGLPWRDSPYAGVRWKKLHFDADSGRSAVLLSFRPGASYGTHRHPAGERYLVLEGALQDGGRSYGKGTYVEHRPGSIHRPSSATGCLLFVTLDRPIEELDAGDAKR